ncbi:hypothetical protein TTHERM_01188420 (macronuclear) [Tetrahymena thermophila SB210]|uniref:Kinase domain protein n=1 Tax=Tetrahymena thermophila (strain SB210) TaxID=312017 RepID=Q239Q5_TETTS|nr:hypothetical protein TTHERM_01188420 [Tetrahymena thermophila SB210]EAR93260.3 hypothetical protein TTHERM_01188420 [Tetrahymena thermophila SB210]|eukprot:XP_001013505.3 hypothetical protein TTHERM_01188420 [Tetrahymena thermophila SB210]
MDNTTQNLKCNKHPNKNHEFIQINDVLTQQISTNPLFYCSSCFNNDLNFKSINYLMIEQIIQEADTQIIPKWPPVNDYQIISDLFDLSQKQSSLGCVKQITDFFDQLKEEFLNKINLIQKKMINEALKYPDDPQQILKRYQEISNILQFKQLLNNEKLNNIQDHSILCKEFISKMESQKDKNTELLQNLLTQANQMQTNFNMEYPHVIKQQLFTLIDQISFFNLDITELSNTNHNNTRNQMETNIKNQNNQIGDLKVTSDLITNSFNDENEFEFFRNSKDIKLNTSFEESLLNLDLKLFATQWDNGQANCVINKKENGYYEIEKLNNNKWVNCISNINLQKNQKYIFRIKLESLNEAYFMIGLMRNSNADSDYGFREYLSCYLYQSNQSVIKTGGQGIDKQLKGEGFTTSGENMIELRLCLKEQILEVLDYPNYEYKLGLEDKYKEKLSQFDDLRFYLGFRDKGSKYILMDIKDYKELNEFLYSSLQSHQVLHIDLSCIYIEDEDALRLGYALKNYIYLSNLILDIPHCNISYVGVSGLGYALANCLNLSNLTLGFCFNWFGDEGASSLGSALAKCITLSNLTLDLYQNQIGDKGASGLFSGLGNCINLSTLTLDLHGNQIGDKGASGLFSGLGNCINLSTLTLNLSYNQIGDEVASALGSALTKCINLSNLTLNLSDNEIGDEGASSLGSALAKCFNLSNLTLDLQQKQFICFGL